MVPVKQMGCQMGSKCTSMAVKGAFHCHTLSRAGQLVNVTMMWPLVLKATDRTMTYLVVGNSAKKVYTAVVRAAPDLCLDEGT